MLYGTPWDYKAGWNFFYNSYWGIPAWFVAWNLRRATRSKQLPGLEKHMKREDFEYYDRAFKECKGYKQMIKTIWLPMFGMKTKDEFLRKMTLNGRLNQIKMPLFALGAMDDLILDPKAVPNREVSEGDSPAIIATTDKGAHCALLTGTLLPKCWYQEPCIEFLDFIESKRAKERKNK